MHFLAAQNMPILEGGHWGACCHGPFLLRGRRNCRVSARDTQATSAVRMIDINFHLCPSNAEPAFQPMSRRSPTPYPHLRTHTPHTLTPPHSASYTLPTRSNFGVNDNPNAVLVTAFGFGMAITVLVYATAHLSGGHLNPAVTLGLMIIGNTHWLTGIVYIVMQFLGAMLGVLLVYLQTPGLAEYGVNKLARYGEFSPPKCADCDWEYQPHPHDGWLGCSYHGMHAFLVALGIIVNSGSLRLCLHMFLCLCVCVCVCVCACVWFRFWL